MQDKINRYVDLLLKWNKTYNLTKIVRREEIFQRHVGESLDLVPFIKPGMKIIDVGTGAGIPGIILAIACPDAKFYLCEIVDKKITFLRQAIIELGLKNCEVVNKRIEEYNPKFSFDLIISKAFASLEKFINLTEHLSDLETKFITFKTNELSLQEGTKVNADIIIDAIINQEVKKNEQTKKLVILKRIK